ncbi:MAG: glycosyltransferase, partial [Candidatus Omnitrophota bacterium]
SVRVIGDAPDIHAAVEDSCVSVAPMRVAVGIQNKILQSMAFRIPVVTTTRGLGGIQAKPGRDILISDNPLEFAENVIMLMENPALRERLRENAYRLVKEKYFWPRIAEELNKKLLSLI